MSAAARAEAASLPDLGHRGDHVRQLADLGRHAPSACLVLDSTAAAITCAISPTSAATAIAGLVVDLDRRGANSPTSAGPAIMGAAASAGASSPT